MSSTRTSNEHPTPIPIAATIGLKSDWYAAYIIARERGGTPEQATRDGALDMEGAGR